MWGAPGGLLASESRLRGPSVLAERSTKYRPKPRAWYRSPWVTALVVVGFVAVVAVILVIPVWATDTPTYCMSCKATRVAGERWKTSSHSNVSCTACHVPAGLGNAIKWRSREWLNVWADYLNVPRSPSVGQRPGNANCLKCHTLKGIPGPHRRHPHAAPGAREPAQPLVRRLPRQGRAPRAGREDDRVHGRVQHVPQHRGRPEQLHLLPHHAAVSERAPQGLHPDSRSAGARRTSRPASAATTTRRSSATPATPSRRRTTSRGPGATRTARRPRRSRSRCTGCHDAKTFCAQCHLVNHPSDWVTTHGPIAARSGGACLVCHPQAMCDACHKQRGVTP